MDDTYCSVNPATDSIIPTIVSTSQDNDQFYIKIHVEIVYPPLAEQDDDEDEPDYLNLETRSHDTQVFVPRDLLTRNDNTSWSVISGYLSTAGIPIHVQPTMIHRISCCAKEMASANHNVGRKVLPMTVFVSYVDFDQVAGRGPSMEVKPVAASESALAGLKKVVILEEEELNNCRVCLEGMKAGTEARRMPCEHCFHQDCIFKWLRISNFCPLCRFQLSNAD